MRFYTTQHQYYGGIDLHARTMVPLCLKPGRRDSAPPEHASGPRLVPQGHCALPGRSGRLRRMDSSPGMGWPISVRAKEFLLCSATPFT
jgi:hypothetical protein